MKNQQDAAREKRQDRETTNLKIRHTNQDHVDKVNKLRRKKTSTSLVDSIMDVISGSPSVSKPSLVESVESVMRPIEEFNSDQTLNFVEDLLDMVELELNEAGNETVSQIKSVGSNKKSLLVLIGNGITRMRTDKDDRGIVILIAALGILASAGEDEGLINLAKRIASIGLTTRGKK